MPVKPRLPVAAPPAAAPRYGLLASIPPSTEFGDDWRGDGISYSPEGCVEGEGFEPCAVGSPGLAINSRREKVEWDAYKLSIDEECSTFSTAAELDEVAARGERLLNMDTERQLGLELWEGVISQTFSPASVNTWLANAADPNLVVLGDGPVGLVHGLSCLEQYAADVNGGQQAAIHATVQVVTFWESFRLLRREGNRILTFQDNIVIPSPGYSGVSPDGTIGTNDVWAYVTDVPRIFLGPITVAPMMDSIDRRRNTSLVVSQRDALVEWQRCRHAGIQLCVVPCGSY